MDSDQSTSSSSCDCETCPQELTILVDGSNPEFKDFLEYHMVNYQKLYPRVRIKLETEPTNTLDDRLINEGSTWDGAVFPAQMVGTLMQREALWDLSSYVKHSSELEWPEVLPFFRQVQAVYGSSTAVLPLDGDVLSMFYRKDLLDEYNMTVPRTWDEYLETAKFFHGKPLGPNGEKLYGSCVSRTDNCVNDYWTNLMLSSITQTEGTLSGFFLDPQTLDPLFGTAMEETLRILSGQFLYGHPTEVNGDCLTSNFEFNKGRCALTYNWGNQITMNARTTNDFDIGVAPTPGSQFVLDRNSGELVKCTPETCPHGVYYSDLGVVNHAPYSAFGGWAAGVSRSSSSGQQYAAADFFAYVSNSRQSLGDILPNPRSTFAQAYRYSHVTSLNWMHASAFEEDLAVEYTNSVRRINSENSALELRLPLSNSLREIVDQEVFDYILAYGADLSMDLSKQQSLRKETTLRMEERIQQAIVSADESSEVSVIELYRASLGYNSTSSDETMNFIDPNFRDGGWGLGGLLCVAAISILGWIIFNRNNQVMKAFQPLLLILAAVGLFLLGGTIIPLGFDDSLFEPDVLDITCMLAPWLYVWGFTIFFSSVYCKIQECMKIYVEPHKFDVLVVTPKAVILLCSRLLLLNSTILGIWTGVDPLKWVRQPVDGGIVFEDGTVETYGSCTGGHASMAFACILFVSNIIMGLVATAQAFKCRYLVLEYNETQWLPLSIFPFVEVWLVGGPIVVFVRDQPTILFNVLTLIIVVGSVTATMAVFAPKDWYIRKFRDSGSTINKRTYKRKDSAGIMVLKHPTVESQKQVEGLKVNLEQVQAWNTELEIEIRMMRDRFEKLTANQKIEVCQSLFRESTNNKANSWDYRDKDPVSASDAPRANEQDLADMEKFQQVWAMPDEDDEPEEEIIPVALTHSISRDNSFASLEGSLLDSDTQSPLATMQKTSGKNEAPATQAAIAPSKTADDDRSQGDVSDTSRGSDYIPEDPLARLARMAEEDDDSGYDMGNSRDDSSDYTPAAALATLAAKEKEKEDKKTPQPPPPPPTSNGRANNQKEEEDDISYSSRGSDYIPEDPLARLARMAEEDDDDDEPMIAQDTSTNTAKNPTPIKIPIRDDVSDTSRGSDYVPEDPLAMIARMVEEEEDEAGLPGLPGQNDVSVFEDRDSKEYETAPNKKEPSMDLKTISFIDMSYEDDDDSNDPDAVIRKKDFSELGSMISADDFDALERKASMLAESLKTKLAVSQLADLSIDETIEADQSTDQDSSVFFIPFGIARRNTSQDGLSDLDISKITADKGDKSFITMSDSILESPARGGDKNTGAALLAPNTSVNGSDHSGSSHLMFPPTGESSAADVRSASTPQSSLPDYGATYPTQEAGEPSYGEWRDGEEKKSFDTSGEVEKSEEDSSEQQKSFHLGDWSAAGYTASLLQNWSDSNSSVTSNGEASVSSLEATTRASALDTPMAKKLDSLVGKMDFDGVAQVAEKFETTGMSSRPAMKKLPSARTMATDANVFDDDRGAKIAEKKRKKRELEAFRDSISKSINRG